MIAPWTGLGAREERWFRVVVFLVWSIKPLVEPVRSLADVPESAFEFVLPLRVVPEAARTAFLHAGALGALDVILTLVALGAAAGVRLRATASITVAAAFVHQALLNSLGYIGHESIALWLATLGFVLLRTGRNTARVDDLFLLRAAIVTVTYALTGLYRLMHGVPDVFVDASLPYWSTRNQLYDCWEARLAAACMPTDGPLAAGGFLCRAAFVGVAALEVIAPLALVWRRFARFLVPALILFHLASLVVLGILFWENVVLLALLGLALCGGNQNRGVQASIGAESGPATTPSGGGDVASSANASSR